MAEHPLVAVCVAPADLRPVVDPLTGSVHPDPRRADLSAADGAAVEYGLRVAEAWGGRVLVVAAGPVEIQPALLEVVALGAAVVRIETGEHSGPSGSHPASLAGDPSGLATDLARIIAERGRPALVLCGDRSAERGVGAVPALVADRLGLPQVLGAVALELRPGSGLTAERRLDGGWRETVVVDRPAVVSVEAAGVRLRRAGLAGALAAGSEVVEVVEASRRPDRPGPVSYGSPRPYRPRTRPVPPPRGDAHHRLLELTGALTDREPPRVIGPLDAGAAAEELLSYLDRNGFGPHHP